MKNKNILNFLNKPLVYWTLKAAIKSSLIDDIVVSTNSSRVKQIAKQFKNIIVHNRGEKFSTSKSKSESVIIDLLQYYKFNHDYLILLQPTSPLRSAQDIDLSLKKTINNSANNCVSVQSFPKNLNQIYKIKNKKINIISKKSCEIFIMNGSIYISKISKFLKDHCFVDNNTIPFIMNSTSSIDIDNIKDFRIAEFIMRNNLHKL